MKQKRLKQKISAYIIGLLTVWLTLPVAHSALSSTNYSVTRAVLSSAGNISSSLNYAAQSVVGQTAVSTSTSISYINNAGFLSSSDTDGDGIFDFSDNCINDINPAQLDTDSDGSGNVCDLDDDDDGLSDVLEGVLGTNLLLADTDNDGLSDFVEVGFDGDPSNYQLGVDTDPNNSDTDGDGLLDGFDLFPLISGHDGDLAPLGAPDGVINAADLLIARRIILGEIIASSLELSHGDVFPPGSPDGVINIQDFLLIQSLALP